jgi:hypothetical protein
MLYVHILDLQCIYITLRCNISGYVGGYRQFEIYTLFYEIFYCDVIITLQYFLYILLWYTIYWDLQCVYITTTSLVHDRGGLSIFSCYLPSIYNTFKLKCPPYHCSVYTWFRSRDDLHGTWVVEQEFKGDSALAIVICDLCDLCDLCADVSCLSSRSIYLRTS